jgi:hypothetical protein
MVKFNKTFHPDSHLKKRASSHAVVAVESTELTVPTLVEAVPTVSTKVVLPALNWYEYASEKHPNHLRMTLVDYYKHLNLGPDQHGR